MIEYSELVRAVRDFVLAADLYRARAGRERGLNPSAVTALAHLRLEGARTPTELARQLDITTASATDLLDRLQRDGHVRRRPHPTDRRKLLVDLTDDGAAAIDDILRGFATGLGNSVDHGNRQEHDSVLTFVRTARRALLAEQGEAS